MRDCRPHSAPYDGRRQHFAQQPNSEKGKAASAAGLASTERSIRPFSSGSPKRTVFWLVQKENDPLGGERLPPHKVKIRSHKTGAVDAKGNAVTAPYLDLLRVGKGAHDDGEDGDQPFTFREPGDETGPKLKPKPFEEKALVALARAIKTHGFVAAGDSRRRPNRFGGAVASRIRGRRQARQPRRPAKGVQSSLRSDDRKRPCCNPRRPRSAIGINRSVMMT
jgi:hypothetical protein